MEQKVEVQHECATAWAELKEEAFFLRRTLAALLAALGLCQRHGCLRCTRRGKGMPCALEDAVNSAEKALDCIQLEGEK